MKFEHQYDESSPKITVEVDKDSPFPELLDAFVSFSTAITYSKDTIEGCIKDLADSYDTECYIDVSNFTNGKLSTPVSFCSNCKLDTPTKITANGSICAECSCLK